jgi:predicted nucleic acid-binding protein
VKRFVLDASVALAWVADSPMDAYAAEIELAVSDGARALVPALWQLEVANGLLMAERRKVLTPADAEQGLFDMERFLASSAEVDGTGAGMRQVTNLARTYQLTAYDAAYLELAIREGLPLATLDKELRAAATKAGVPAL